MIDFEAMNAGQYNADAKLAIMSYLSRYSGQTLKTYSVSLRLLFAWLNENDITLLDATRPQLEMFVRYLEQERSNGPTSVNHHLTAVTGLYKYAQIDGIIMRDPAAYVRKPKMYHDPHKINFLTNIEMRAVVAAAKRSKYPSDQGMIALLAGCGLRVTETINVSVEDYATTSAGYRVLKLIGKGGKPATIPLPVPLLRMLEVSRGDRTQGPLLIRDAFSHMHAGEKVTYRSVRSSIDRLCSNAGIERKINPHAFRHGYITAGLGAGISLRDMQIAARHSDPRTTAHYDHSDKNLDRHANHILAASLVGAS